MLATNASIRVIKTFTFKGGTRAWSNRYHFNGGTPADATHWHTLMDNVVTAEKEILTPGVTITECVGYAAGSEVPVASKNYTTVGVSGLSGGSALDPGECAGLIRYSTSVRSTKNHPVYLFNYYHGVASPTGASTVDHLDLTLVGNYDVYAAAWIAGFSDGTITCVRAGPQGEAATGHLTETMVTHRDFR